MQRCYGEEQGQAQGTPPDRSVEDEREGFVA
jgi:hypothetical protein